MSSRRARRAWVLTPLAAVLIAAVASAPASVHSAGGIRYVAKGSKVSGSKSGTLKAPCPEGTHVLGGGEVNKGGYNTILLRQTFPFDSGDKDQKPDDGWKVRIKNQGSHTVTVKAEAVCGKTKVRYVAVRFVAPADTQSDETEATCPPNTFAYSGGVSAPAGSKIFPNSTFPAGGTGATEWGTYLDNPAAQDEDKAAVIAVCGQSKPEITSATIHNAMPNAQAGLKPPCPAGTHVYGGGQDNDGGFHTVATNTLGPATVNGVPGAAWSSRTDMTSATPRTVTGFAVCGPKLN